MRLRCRLGFHGVLSQGHVGYCRHVDCPHFVQVYHHPCGGWTRYTTPPLPRSRGRGIPS